MNKELKFAIEEIKTLILIGGTPILIVMFINLCVACIFSGETVRGLYIIGYGLLIAGLTSIFILFKRIWNKLK